MAETKDFLGNRILYKAMVFCTIYPFRNFILILTGLEEPPLIQRIFWCITIAACTSALIVYTEFTDRADVNAFAILAGLPFAVLMCFCAISLWR